ncbi:hypothetical protein OG2516_03710 [Oceanicola granulosus HTCC2516]|uniref:Uncharacterized protein n=1 Tax=Oceanicola granulosus (strain ATCC BAA-861 / DSM 15982 / KCTC 12143 / HTCC2516) TaxID=314256 RepID=Q2CG69_OCEGH|nr:hypothetical protein [Oceanicola granulosus]EAR51660.1 hypothetical protein OG2516_03710 [Oceanicola granulosus HTCC2516]
MSLTDDVADRLALETIELMDRLGDDRIAEAVAKSLGASSQTTEEAFRTAIRVRLAERRARAALKEIEAQGGLKE